MHLTRDSRKPSLFFFLFLHMLHVSSLFSVYFMREMTAYIHITT